MENIPSSRLEQIWHWSQRHLFDQVSAISGAFALLCIGYLAVVAKATVTLAYDPTASHPFVDKPLPQSTAFLLAGSMSYLVVFVSKNVRGDLRIQFGKFSVEGPVCGTLLWLAGMVVGLLFFRLYP